MKKLIKINSYYVFLFFITLYYTLNNVCLTTDISDIKNIMIWLGVLFFLITFIRSILSFKELLLSLFVLICGCISSFTVNNTAILILFAVMITSKRKNPNKTIKYLFKLKLILFILVLLSFFSELINEKTIYRDGVVRHSLGFGHPNGLGLYFFLLVVMYILSYGIYLKDRERYFSAFIIFLLHIIVYGYSQSRTQFICVLLALFFYSVYKLNFFTKIVAGFCKYIPITMVLINYFIVLVSHTSLFAILDAFLSSRFAMASSFYERVGLSLWGRPVPYVSNDYAYWVLDSGYWNLILGFGCVTSALLLILMVISLNNEYKSTRYLIVLMISCFMIYAFTEDIISSFYSNIFIIYIGNTLILNKSDNVKNILFLHNTRRTINEKNRDFNIS